MDVCVVCVANGKMQDNQDKETRTDEVQMEHNKMKKHVRMKYKWSTTK
jgi:hypothetical protein